jgi:hypothetical protein
MGRAGSYRSLVGGHPEGLRNERAVGAFQCDQDGVVTPVTANGAASGEEPEPQHVMRAASVEFAALAREPVPVRLARVLPGVNRSRATV